MRRSQLFGYTTTCALSIAAPAVAGMPIFGLSLYDAETDKRLDVQTDDTRLGGSVVGLTARPSINNSTNGYRSFRWDPIHGRFDELGGIGNGPLPSGWTENRVGAVNAAGVVIGRASQYANGEDLGSRAVRWDPGSNAAIELGGLGTTNTRFDFGAAQGINSAGMVVGVVTKVVNGVDMGGRAVRWNPGSTTPVELGTIGRTSDGYSYAQAWAVNDSGTIVGAGYKFSGNTIAGQRAIRWAAGGTTAVELRGLGTNSSGYTTSWAQAINASGVTIGWADKYTNFVSQGTRGVRWNAGSTTATELGDLGDGNGGWGNAISDDGTIVGWAGKAVGGTPVGARPVKWLPGAIVPTELGYFGPDAYGQISGTAGAINNANLIVGYLNASGATGSSESCPVLWDKNGTPVDLNSFLPANSGWKLTYAREINNSNWVSGWGRFDPDGGGPLPSANQPFLMKLPYAGDADGNEVVDFNDFLTLQNSFNQSRTATSLSAADFNYDGVTDFNDFLILQNHFGQSLDGNSVPLTANEVAALNAFAAAVPEPGHLAMIAVLATAGRRRRS